MELGFIPFVVVPLIVYTYFWINPFAFASFWEGFIKYLVEIYLGYKAWKIEFDTWIAYKRYVIASKKLAMKSGLSGRAVKLYFKTYFDSDITEIKRIERQIYEEKHKQLEDSLRNMIVF